MEDLQNMQKTEDEIDSIIKDAIDHINLVTLARYSYQDMVANKLLYNLILEGHSINDFIVVIDKKWNDWEGTQFQKYVRIETLFGIKFKKYLDEQPRIASTTISKLTSAVEKAKQHRWRMDKK